MGPYPHTPYDSQLSRVRDLIGNLSVETAAATVQEFVEDTVFHIASALFEAYDVHSLSVAGGLFANVSANRRLTELGVLERLIVHPAMSDAGLAVGAACSSFVKRTGRRPQALADVFLGPSYSQNEMSSLFQGAGYLQVRCGNPEDTLAFALAGGHIVARFYGRAEYGPRALGNRSILAPANDVSVISKLNSKLRRSMIMPFAPVSPSDIGSALYLNTNKTLWSTQFMTVALECTNLMRSDAPAAVHIDNSARPQVVFPNVNPRFYRILDQYRRRTGRISLINTSLNLHEEPMVLSPLDALMTVASAGIDIIQAGETVFVANEALRNILELDYA